MRNNAMTGPIILSEEDSLQLRQDVFNPTSEYLRERQQYFEKLASSMVIHKEGPNTRVDFKDLDLSNLDALIEKEKNDSSAQILMQTSKYTSVTTKTSFTNIHKNILSKIVYKNETTNAFETSYSYNKPQKNTEFPDNNLTEAA